MSINDEVISDEIDTAKIIDIIDNIAHCIGGG